MQIGWHFCVIIRLTVIFFSLSAVNVYVDFWIIIANYFDLCQFSNYICTRNNKDFRKIYNYIRLKLLKHSLNGYSLDVKSRLFFV